MQKIKVGTKKAKQQRKKKRDDMSDSASEQEDEKEVVSSENKVLTVIKGWNDFDSSLSRELSPIGATHKPRALNLFDGAGISRLGLEQAGFSVTGVEMDQRKHYLSQHLGSPELLVLADVRKLPLDFFHSFAVIFASPPCKQRSVLRVASKFVGPADEHGDDLLNWCFETLPHPNLKVLVIENVFSTNTTSKDNQWGVRFNAAQFTDPPVQSRARLIGGKYPMPKVLHEEHPSYRRIGGVKFVSMQDQRKEKPKWIKKRGCSALYNSKQDYTIQQTLSKRQCRQQGLETMFHGVCPAITASEWKMPMTSKAGTSVKESYRVYGSKFYGRRITLDQAAMHCGLTTGIPEVWRTRPADKDWGECTQDDVFWHRVIYDAIGNSFPVFMSRAFAQAAFDSLKIFGSTTKWVDTLDKRAKQYGPNFVVSSEISGSSGSSSSTIHDTVPPDFKANCPWKTTLTIEACQTCSKNHPATSTKLADSFEIWSQSPCVSMLSSSSAET
jgi:site-specific DNA-cytosine methylase